MVRLVTIILCIELLCSFISVQISPFNLRYKLNYLSVRLILLVQLYSHNMTNILLEMIENINYAVYSIHVHAPFIVYIKYYM